MGNVASVLEKLQQIVKLAMNVTADCDWRIYTLDVALLYQNLTCLRTQVLDLLL